MFQQPTQDQMNQIIAQAHAERAQYLSQLITNLFRRKAVPVPA